MLLCYDRVVIAGHCQRARIDRRACHTQRCGRIAGKARWCGAVGCKARQRTGERRQGRTAEGIPGRLSVRLFASPWVAGTASTLADKALIEPGHHHQEWLRLFGGGDHRGVQPACPSRSARHPPRGRWRVAGHAAGHRIEVVVEPLLPSTIVLGL